MIANETMLEIVQLSLKPILNRLSERAYEEVVTNFCKPNCQKNPEGRLCRGAERVHRKVLTLLFEKYARLN